MGGNDVELMIKAAEVAQRLGIGHETVLKWVRDKGMPCYRTPGTGDSRAYLFRMSEVDAWLVRINEARLNGKGAKDNE